jgi:hypothetical protein
MRRDDLTADMFADLPKPVPLDSAAIDVKVMVARAMSRAMKNCPFDRYEIAARMSRALNREITKNMLDAYASAARDTHIPNIEFCIHFDYATSQRELLSLYASLLGHGVMVGDDALRAKLGQLELQEQEVRANKRELKRYLSRKGARR